MPTPQMYGKCVEERDKLRAEVRGLNGLVADLRHTITEYQQREKERESPHFGLGKMREVEKENGSLKLRLQDKDAALREAETLLCNYLAEGKFPRGSDCDEVKGIVVRALRGSEVCSCPDYEGGKIQPFCTVHGLPMTGHSA